MSSHNFFKKYYIESWDYIKESKKFIYLVFFLFFFFGIVGFFFPAPDAVIEQILKFIEELLTKIEGMNQFELINFILLNNLQSSFTSMIFGTLFGIFPLIAVIANGYILGFVSAMSVKAGGVLVLWKLIPHGIFELPAIFISMGLGLKLGTFILQKNKIESFKRYLWKSIIVFLFVVLPLLILGAIIEGSLIFAAM